MRHRPELLETLLDPDQVAVEKRVIQLPLKGEVTLSVVHISPGAYRTMDILEKLVRTQEHFMAVPLPRSYIGLLVADAIPVGGGPSGMITVDPGSAENGRLIAHELAHTYWPFFPPWIAEGAADFMTTVSAGMEFHPMSAALRTTSPIWTVSIWSKPNRDCPRTTSTGRAAPTLWGVGCLSTCTKPWGMGLSGKGSEGYIWR